jgi:hypothetical protein
MVFQQYHAHLPELPVMEKTIRSCTVSEDEIRNDVVMEKFGYVGGTAKYCSLTREQILPAGSPCR